MKWLNKEPGWVLSVGMYIGASLMLMSWAIQIGLWVAVLYKVNVLAAGFVTGLLIFGSSIVSWVIHENFKEKP